MVMVPFGSFSSLDQWAAAQLVTIISHLTLSLYLSTVLADIGMVVARTCKAKGKVGRKTKATQLESVRTLGRLLELTD
jgi:hypothetical protein